MDASLRAENQYQKQKRTHHEDTIQRSGSLAIQDGLQSSVVVEQSAVETEDGTIQLASQKQQLQEPHQGTASVSSS